MTDSLNNKLNGASRGMQASKHLLRTGVACCLPGLALVLLWSASSFLVGFKLRDPIPLLTVSLNLPLPFQSFCQACLCSLGLPEWQQSSFKSQILVLSVQKSSSWVHSLSHHSANRHHPAITLIFHYSPDPQFSRGKLRPAPLLSSSFPSQQLSLPSLCRTTYSAHSLCTFAMSPLTLPGMYPSQHPCQTASGTTPKATSLNCCTIQPPTPFYYLQVAFFPNILKQL